jgi:hypothetical protein
MEHPMIAIALRAASARLTHCLLCLDAYLTGLEQLVDAAWESHSPNAEELDAELCVVRERHAELHTDSSRLRRSPRTRISNNDVAVPNSPSSASRPATSSGLLRKQRLKTLGLSRAESVRDARTS